MKLAFVGLKGSGKSTFAHMFTDNVYSFATPLKKATNHLFDVDVYSSSGKQKTIQIPENIQSNRLYDACLEFFDLSDDDFLYDEELDLHGGATATDLLECFREAVQENFSGKTMTAREILQKMGTEVGRDTFGDDIWIRNMLSRIEGEEEVVVDDCRFLNEAMALRNKGFTIIGIDRPGLEVDKHPSEMEMVERWDIMVDLTVKNDGTIQETFHNIQQSLEK